MAISGGESRHQTPQVQRRLLVLRLSFVLAADGQPGDAVEIVVRVLAGPVDQQVLLLVDQVLTPVLAHLEVGGELDGVGRAGLLAEAPEDAAREAGLSPAAGTRVGRPTTSLSPSSA